MVGYVSYTVVHLISFFFSFFASQIIKISSVQYLVNLQRKHKRILYDNQNGPKHNTFDHLASEGAMIEQTFYHGPDVIYRYNRPNSSGPEKRKDAVSQKWDDFRQITSFHPLPRFIDSY